jgi:hypothetical protein
VLISFAALSCAIPSFSQQQGAPAPAPGASTEDLQKATQNPVASLISVPIQNNNNFNIGPYDRTQDVLNTTEGPMLNFPWPRIVLVAVGMTKAGPTPQISLPGFAGDRKNVEFMSPSPNSPPVG